MTEQVEIIVINWEKIPFASSTAFNRVWDFGLYQIYGGHNSYGKDSLLYIGKARDNTFSQRLLNDKRLHSDFNETTIYPEYIRLGWIVKSNKDLKPIYEEEKWSEYIDIAENLLISSHCPAMNSQLDLKLYQIGEKYDNKNVIILNIGDKGNILPEISTFRNTYKFYEYETPFGYVKNETTNQSQ